MEEKEKTPRGQTKNFPLTALIVAEAVTKAVSDAGGKIDSKALSDSLNVKGGAFARKVASAKRWNLIKGIGKIEITNLGKRVVHHISDQELLQSRKEAFLSIPFFKELYERFGAQIPNSQTFTAILIREYNTSEKDAKTILNIYKEAIKLNILKDSKIQRKSPKFGEESRFSDFPEDLLENVVSIRVTSQLGDNIFKADDKEGFDNIKLKLNTLFGLIDDEFPEEKKIKDETRKNDNTLHEEEGHSAVMGS